MASACSVDINSFGSPGYQILGRPPLSILPLHTPTNQLSQPAHGHHSRFLQLPSLLSALRTLQEVCKWKGMTYSCTMSLTTTRPRWRSTTPSRRTQTHSLAWLVDFGYLDHLVTGGMDMETSRSSEHIPSVLEALPISGLASWAIERSPSSRTDVAHP